MVDCCKETSAASVPPQIRSVQLGAAVGRRPILETQGMANQSAGQLFGVLLDPIMAGTAKFEFPDSEKLRVLLLPPEKHNQNANTSRANTKNCKCEGLSQPMSLKLLP